PAGVCREPGHLREGRRPAGVVAQQREELLLEVRIGLRRLVDLGELVDGGDQRLGHVPTAELAEERSRGRAQTHEDSPSPPAASSAARKDRSVATGLPVTSASPMSTTSAPAAR